MPFIPITSVYATLLIMATLYPLYHLGSKSHTHLESNHYCQQAADELLFSKTILFIVLMAFAELNGCSIQLLHLLGVTWCMCILFKVWSHLRQTPHMRHAHAINYATSFIILSLCVMNFMVSWPIFVTF